MSRLEPPTAQARLAERIQHRAARHKPSLAERAAEAATSIGIAALALLALFCVIIGLGTLVGVFVGQIHSVAAWWVS